MKTSILFTLSFIFCHVTAGIAQVRVINLKTWNF